MEKKYKFTNETREYKGKTLHRIVALRDFSNVIAGEKGGWIEKEDNLSHEGNCWVSDNAIVCDKACVYGNAIVERRSCVYNKAAVSEHAIITECAFVFGDAHIGGYALVGGKTRIYGKALVSGNAFVDGNSVICGNAVIKDKEDFIVFKNWWSSGRYFTWTRSNDKYKVGCFYGTGKELIEAAYNHDEKRGREYERIVNYVNSIKNNGK